MDHEQAVGAAPRRLFFRNAGFATDRHLRRIMQLAGHELALWGRPGAGEGVVVWGASPHAGRGVRLAEAAGVALVRVEDAFLRSVHPGRAGGAGALGLMIDARGVHFDARKPSMLEGILARHPLDDTPLLARARDGIGRLKALDLSKYNSHDPRQEAPAPGYVLVVDQTRGDASLMGAARAEFQAMLAQALDDHPHARVVIKLHPETQAGHRPGHFGAADAGGRVSLCDAAVSPWQMLDGAIAVYVMSSQLGFEAILAGHKPQVFGQPFYAGWGLTVDHAGPIARRGRKLTAVQMFAGAMILAPVWYDRARDRLCGFEAAVDQLEAEVRAWREDRAGHVAAGMRAWKRGPLGAMFGGVRALRFARDGAAAARMAARTGRGVLVWGAAPAPEGVAVRRVEDGFLRSSGLGAALVPPLSLVADDLGIYYDPNHESRFEALMRAPLPPGGAARAAALRAAVVAGGVTKYNLAGAQPDLPPGHRILVPGQVADDASIRLGCGEVTDNLGLLRAVRAANPDAVIVWKPHPDVEAGLRAGAVALGDLAGLADVVASGQSAAALIAACDEVWTLTSTLGFEALLRGKPVTTLGAPFYAGWGLTRDLGLMPEGWGLTGAGDAALAEGLAEGLAAAEAPDSETPGVAAPGSEATGVAASRSAAPPPSAPSTVVQLFPTAHTSPAPTAAPAPMDNPRFSVIPARRVMDGAGMRFQPRSLDHLTHAALISYPRYRDPVSGLACPAEVIVERLAKGEVPPPSRALRALARLQGLLAPWAGLWRG